jgi:hypothetical protein
LLKSFSEGILLLSYAGFISLAASEGSSRLGRFVAGGEELFSGVEEVFSSTISFFF